MTARRACVDSVNGVAPCELYLNFWVLCFHLSEQHENTHRDLQRKVKSWKKSIIKGAKHLQRRKQLILTNIHQTGLNVLKTELAAQTKGRTCHWNVYQIPQWKKKKVTLGTCEKQFWTPQGLKCLLWTSLILKGYYSSKQTKNTLQLILTMK